ncbi:hypothetical protein ACNSTU_07295 [Aquisalimonas sp. APHAB1-3]|uniref:hypothetical protein n=1 Tax=Aquisalimonas sp. APHAB1-3 TaxID=3402080 RepID=UPI003AACD46C
MNSRHASEALEEVKQRMAGTALARHVEEGLAFGEMDDFLEALSDLLRDSGLAFDTEVTSGSEGVAITSRLQHLSGDEMPLHASLGRGISQDRVEELCQFAKFRHVLKLFGLAPG